MIHYFNKGTNFGPKFKKKINKWIKSVANFHGYNRLNLNYIFCSDDEILKINRQFLRHDYYTDIITFDTSDDQSFRKSSLYGDIFISVDTVMSNASVFGVSFENELHRVMIHGVLHLIGYDDVTPELEAEMHHQEDLALLTYDCQ